jgi:putative ABC transport system permease protein
VRLALRLARRELRGGVVGLRIVLACLALGVGAIAAVGTLRAGLERGLAAEGRTLLGGDLEVESGAAPLPDALRAWFAARGARLSDAVTMRSMLIAPSGARLLVELKAVDAAWPLAGAASLDPPGRVEATLQAAGGAFGAVADPLVFQRLGVAPGATVRLGNVSVVLRARLVSEPDRVAGVAFLGPRVLIATVALPASGLLQPGSIAEHRLRVALPPGARAAAEVAALRAAFPGTGWRIRTPAEAAPGMARFFSETAQFLTLVGLTALLVGGIGVANGVRAWLEARAHGIATLRCLGASPRLVLSVCFLQVMALTLLAVAIGVVAGAALPALAAPALAGLLPVAPRLGPFPVPLALAASYGVLTALAFALPPLGRAMRLSGAALLRTPDAFPPGRPPLGLLGLATAAAAALVALVVATSPDPRFAFGFCVAAGASLALLAGGGATVRVLAARLPAPRRAWARLGIANLHRPGAPTPLVLVSVGLGLATLAAVVLVEGNVRRDLEAELPARAPSLFLIDIQAAQADEVRRIALATPGVEDYAAVPSLRARIVALNGVPAERARVSPETAWALRGDRGLTYAATVPKGSRLVAGAWWPADYAGPPLVSLDAALARGWGVGVGDVVRVAVLGREIDLRVASLRDVAWRTFGLNFTLVASPGLLEHAPHTVIATLRTTPGAAAVVVRRVTDAFPNVSAIAVDEVLSAVAELLGKVGAALAASGSVALASGVLVLAGAVAAGQRRRVREAVILKTLGATRMQVRAAWLVEFGLLGLAAGLLAAAIGAAASWGVLRFAMGADWTFLPGRLAATVAGSLVLLLTAGYAGTEAALRAKAAPLLRNE